MNPRTTLFGGLLALLLLGAAPGESRAQDRDATLFATLIKNKGYVVGSPLAASGLLRYDGDTTWTHLGFSIPRVSGVSYDPLRPDTMYTACGNGVLRTYDGGHSWRITTDWRVTEVQDVAVDPNAPAHVYASSGYGIWRTEDRGETWTESNDGIPQGETYTQAIEVDRTRQGRVLAGTDDGVFVSEDGARSWRRAGGEGLAILDLAQSESDADVWLAATYQHGILLSSDNGESWRPGPKALANKSVHAVAVDPHDARRMAAVGWETGVFVSENGGRSWKRRGDRLPVAKFYEVTFDANDPGRLWAATLEEGVFVSDDLGRTWDYKGLYGTLVFEFRWVYE